MPLVAIVVLGTALGGGAAVWDAFRVAGDEARDKESKAQIARLIEGFSNPYTARFKAADAAISESGAAQALAAGDKAGLESSIRQLRDALPDATAVTLTPANLRDPDYDAEPPITYATLDLIRTSRKSGTQALVEALLVGREREHVVMVRRVVDDKAAVAGFAVASFTVQEMAKALKAADVGTTYVELTQRLPKGKRLRISSAGDVSLRSDAITHTETLAGTSFRLLIWTPAATAQEFGVFADLVPIAAAVILLILAGVGGWVLAVRRSKRLQGRVMLGGAVSATVVDDQGPEGAFAKATKKRELAAHRTGDSPAPSLPAEAISFDDFEDARRNVDDLLDVDEVAPAVGAVSPSSGSQGLSDSIFRAYDIRGVVDETLDADTVTLLGKAIGSEAYERGQQTLIVARDGRVSSQALTDALITGLTASGRDVIDIGQVPTPVLYFSTYFLNTGSGVMMTGSHNPPAYNGLKIMLGGETLFGDAIQSLKVRARAGDFQQGAGQIQSTDLLADYIRRVTEDMPVALGGAFKLVVDCGNGVAGDVAPKLFRALGHDVIELFCEVDGRFPNHHPDPSDPKNLVDLRAAVLENNADLGIALDGDGDRVGIIDNSGATVWPDQLMMVFAKDILSRHAGAPVVYDVKCTSRLRTVIEAAGGTPVMDKTGHSYMRNKLKEMNAPLAGELSGHVFFGERWYGF
ncbi:MAG: phosphomannomutase/phosphoglucomutase, partial [Chromatiales bacterium]|nr:phosphomannomutase/phosphoglucomutase [Chromatiales bacterium]